MTFADFYGCQSHDFHDPLPDQTEQQRQRALSGEVDFGVGWHDGERLVWHRVSWCDRTGEVYAHSHRENTYKVLGATEPGDRQGIERILAGWTDRMHDFDGISWVRRRLANAAQARAS